jgi:pimeloyl-ACP methyl ester carboxylesterase
MEFPARKISFVGRDGVRLAAERVGEATSPPALLLHGGGQTRHAWGGTAQALAAEGWQAISLDQRGHGDSDWADDGEYGFEAFAADLEAVVRDLPAPPVLIGASLGGIASLMAVGELGARARALVLVDVAVRIEAEGVSRIVEFMTAQPEGFETLEEVADAISAYLPHRRRPSDLSGLAKNLRRGDDGRYRWHWDPRFMVGRPPRTLAEGAPERMEAAARNLGLPTLLVRGRLSDLLSEEGARHFLELVPHARFADVSEAGHMVAGDRNDLFTAAVVDFLRTLPPAGEAES